MDATQDADAKTAYGVSFGSSCWPQQNDSGCSADAVITQITGSAYLTGEATYVIDPDDPLKYGFKVGR